MSSPLSQLQATAFVILFASAASFPAVAAPKAAPRSAARPAARPAPVASPVTTPAPNGNWPAPRTSTAAYAERGPELRALISLELANTVGNSTAFSKTEVDGSSSGIGYTLGLGAVIPAEEGVLFILDARLGKHVFKYTVNDESVRMSGTWLEARAMIGYRVYGPLRLALGGFLGGAMGDKYNRAVDSDTTEPELEPQVGNDYGFAVSFETTLPRWGLPVPLFLELSYLHGTSNLVGDNDLEATSRTIILGLSTTFMKF